MRRLQLERLRYARRQASVAETRHEGPLAEAHPEDSSNDPKNDTPVSKPEDINVGQYEQDRVVLNEQQEAGSVSKGYHANTTELYASEADYRASEDGALQVKIISINGLDGKHAWWGDSLSALSLEASKFTFGTSLLLNEDSPAEKIRKAASELLEYVIDILDSCHKDPAIVFVARDIGGTLLKQALLLAVESAQSSYKRVLENTTHLLFFATPHRASERIPWDYIISNLIYQKAQGTSSTWLPRIVRDLAVFHEDIAAQFESFSGQHRFRYINYYQEESNLGYYSIVIPRYAATFGHDGERQMGRGESHSTLANLSPPETAKEFLSVLQDANATTKSEYREAVSLLSQSGLEPVPPRKSKSTYMNLCKLILSAGRLTERNGPGNHGLSDTTMENQHQEALSDSGPVLAADPETTHMRKPTSVERSIQIVDLEECSVDTAALASSLITSIFQAHPRSQYRFITLANHPPRRVPATKLQLLVTLAHQYLTHYPRIFRRVKSVFESVQESLRTCNTSWKELCLERLVKSLLRYHGTDLPFIIIMQPYEEKDDGPVHGMASGLLSWVQQTEIYAKIIAIQYPSPSSGRLDSHTATDKLRDGSEQQIAVRKDHEAEIKQVIKKSARLSMLQGDLARILCDIRIMTPSQWIPTFENHLFTSIPLSTILDQVSNSDHIVTDLMLDSVVESTNPWIKAGLGWIAYAIRPLAYTEFQEVLSHEFGISGHGDLSAMVAEELRKLLSGLVDTNGNVIYLARSEAVALLTARLLRQREQRDPLAGTNSAQFDDWNQTTCHPDLYIARFCIKTLREIFNNRASSETNLYIGAPDISGTLEVDASDSTAYEEKAREIILPPMLTYAADNWLAHVQLWIDSTARPSEQSSEEKELEFITEFIHDQKVTNWWLRNRKSLREKHAGGEGEYDMLHTAELLGLDCRTRQGVLKLATAVELASDNRSTKTPDKSENAFASLVIALAQRGDCDTLAKVDGGLLRELLNEIFQTGADAALCYLAPKNKEFIQQNWTNVMNGAIRMGNLEFFSSQGGCGNSNFEPSLWFIIAEHGSYLPEDALESLKALFPNDRRHVVHLAAASGHSALIGELIEAGFDLNQETSPGVTPLFLAAQQGHYTVTSQLLAAKADISMRSEAQRHSTPLHAASANGYPDVVRLLLEHGGTALDLSAQDHGGNTALHLALASGHIEVAMSLLEAHGNLVATTTPTEMDSSGSVILPVRVPNLNAQNLNLQTPLVSAVQSGSFEIVQGLLHHEVNVNLADKRGKTALHYAAALEMPEILSLLLEVTGVNLEAQDCNGTTPLHEAASQGRPANIEKLLEHRANHNAVDNKDLSPLELASEAGYTVSAKVLLPLYGRRRITASFLKAVSAGNTKMAELLMDAGADKSAVLPQTLTTALHQGASRSDARLVQSLLLRKAELDPRDGYGRTPLYEAACCGAANCLKLLVDAGADANVSDSSGITALIAAATQNYERCVDILLAAPAQRSVQERYTLNIDGLLSNSVSVLSKVLKRVSVDGGEWDVSNFALQQLLQKGIGAAEALDILFENGLKHDRIISDYGTMLHHAVYLDKPELVSFLAKNDCARPGIVYAEHGTPLQIAAWYAKPNALTIVKTLLDEGVDAELGSKEIGSPLHAATRMSEAWSDSGLGERYEEIALAIIDHKPSTINKIAGNYPTVLESAVRCGSVDMVRLILRNSPDMSPVLGAYGTPLHVAVAKGYWRETELIITYGNPTLNQGTPDQEGRLPLHFLSRNSYWDESDYEFLKDGETTLSNEIDKQQRHLAHFCAGIGNDSLLTRVLADHSEALEKVDVDGWTPLHWACRQKSTDTVKLLLGLNANKDALTHRGWRPIDVANYHGFMQDPEIQSLLESDGTTGHMDAPIRCVEGISYDDEETVPVKSAPNRVPYGCDSCGCTIHGPRYRCDKCHSFDMCFKCFRHVRLVHYASHVFQKFDDLGQEVSIINPW